MEALFLLIALAMIFGVVLGPMLRRRRAQRQVMAGFHREVDPLTGHGFVPPAELDVRLPGPDDALVDALDEARRDQDWHPVARLLALTGDAYEQRWQRVQSIAGAAAMELRASRAAGVPDSPQDDGPLSLTKSAPAAAPAAAHSAADARWLREWRAERPNDPAAAQVYAQFLVWQSVGNPGSDENRIVLEEARRVCHEAAELAEADPTPYLTELLIARALRYRTADFESLWSQVRRRAPHHMGAHLAALQYWSERGCGSKEQADAFARDAAAHAPVGTLLPALPLFAVHDHLPEVHTVRTLYQSLEIENAIEAAEFAVDNVEDDHPVRPHILHLLVCFLVRAERYDEAMDALAVVDGYVGAPPWSAAPDPAAEYAAYRALAVAGYHASGGRRSALPPTP